MSPLLSALLACAPVAIDLPDTGDSADSGDTGDTGGTGPVCGPAPRIEVRHEVGPSVLAMDVAPARPWYAPGATDIVVTSHLGNPSTTDLRIADGNCGYPTYELRDTDGNLVWTGTNGDDIDCDRTNPVIVGAGTSFADEMDVPALEAGVYTLSAVHPMDLDPEDADRTWFPAAVSVELVVGGTTCAQARGSAPTPLGLSLQLDAGPTSSFPNTPRPITGLAHGDRAIDGYFGNCGFPEFRLYDGAGQSIWRYSLADAADCSWKIGWAEGEEHGDTTDVPGEVLTTEGDYQAAVQFYWWPYEKTGTPQTLGLRAGWHIAWGED